MSNGFTVYELVDQSGRPLYVGVTDDLGTAMSAHVTEDPWWNDVDVAATIGTTFESEREAKAHAAARIAETQPRHNTRPEPVRRQRGRPRVEVGTLPEVAVLDKIAADREAIPPRTVAAIDAARAAGVPWWAIAEHLKMTTEGVRQAVRRAQA